MPLNAPITVDTLISWWTCTTLLWTSTPIGCGAPILSEVLGVGYSGDAFHITAPEPTGKGAARAMIRAVDDAEGSVSMNDVDYINDHSTFTPIGDVVEINEIRLALSQTRHASDEDSTSPLLVSSTKGARGHLLDVAGAIEAALTIMAGKIC